MFVADPRSCVREIESNICVTRIFFEPSTKWSSMASLVRSEFPQIAAYWLPRNKPGWKPTLIGSLTKGKRPFSELGAKSLRDKPAGKRRRGTLSRIARRFDDERHHNWQRADYALADDWSPYENFVSRKPRPKQYSRIDREVS